MEINGLQTTIEYYKNKQNILQNKLKYDDHTPDETKKIKDYISWYTQQIKKAESEIKIRLDEADY